MWEILIDFASKNILVSIAMLVSCIVFCVLFAYMFFCFLSMAEFSLMIRIMLCSVGVLPCLMLCLFFYDKLIFREANDERIKYIHDISEKYSKDNEIKECANRIVFYDAAVLAYGAEDYARCVKTILKKRAAREIKEKFQ